MAVLQIGLIIFDLIMDILFVNNRARNIPVLYIPRSDNDVVLIILCLIIHSY
jgi:hypothetical protein